MARSLTLAIVLLASCRSPLCAGETRIGDYLFSLDGKPFQPYLIHLHGEPGAPVPGDVFRYAPYWIALGEEKELRLSVVKEEKDWDSLKLDSRGKSRWFAASPSRFVYLKEGEVPGLRAVMILANEVTPWKKLELLDPERVSLTVQLELLRGERELPAFPAGIRRLSLDFQVSADRIDCRSLAGLRQLELLDLQGFCKGTLDLEILKEATGLRFLNLHGGSLKNLHALWAMKELRFLDLNATEGLDALAPLERLSRLREVNLLGTSATAEVARAFERTHPGSHVLQGFDQMVREELQGADRVVLRDRDLLSPEEPQSAAAPPEVRDPQEIARLVESIRIGRGLCAWNCGCIPTLTIGFYRGEKPLTNLTYHHGNLVGFSFAGDVVLTEESHDRLVQWLAAHGVKGPLEERKYDQNQALADRAMTSRTTQGMSPQVAAAFASGDEATFLAAILEDLPSVRDRAKVLLRALGAGNGPLDKLHWQELRVYAGLQRLERKLLLPIAEEALEAPDRQLRRGAVRFWETAGSYLRRRDDKEERKNRGVVVIAGGDADRLLMTHRFKDRKKALAAILDIEGEARSAAVRDLGLLHLSEWAADLPADEVERRVLLALRDPHEMVRRRAILVAGEIGCRKAEGIFLDLLDGKPVAPLPSPELPPEESEGVEDGYLDTGGDGSTADLAALALGYLGSERAKARIEAKAVENDFHHVAMALLGDPGWLREKDFRSGNQALQMAAVEVVVRAKGRVALDSALKYEQTTHWWEEERVALRLRAMLLAEHPPGAEELEKVKDLETLRLWYLNNGDEYLSRFQKK